MMNVLKNSLILVLFFSSSAFSYNTNTNNFTTEQKKVFFESLDLIEKNNKLQEESFKNKSPINIEGEEGIESEARIIITSIKNFFVKTKIPIQNFLETDISKYIGTMVVFKFFGEFIILKLCWLFTFVLAFLGLKKYNEVNKILYMDLNKAKTDDGVDYTIIKVSDSNASMVYKIGIVFLAVISIVILF